MYKKLSELGLDFDEPEIKLFEQYINYFTAYNSKVNLISNNDLKVLFEKHIYDSLAFNLFLKKYKIKDNIKLLDIGTGGGFPAVPLSLVFPQIHILAVDSIRKKINFIDTLKSEMNLKNIEPKCTRVEELKDNYRGSFDVVTSRAMAELRVILEYAMPFVKKGRYFVAYKSLKANEEIKNAQNALEKLNSKVVDIIEYSLPIDDVNKRVLLVIQKEKDTDKIYPRNASLIKNKPL